MKEMPTAGQPVIAFAEACDRGKVREENQDTVLHVQVALGELSIVADGMGGYAGGATASRMVVESIHEYLASLPRDSAPDTAIREAARQANAKILAAASAPDSPYRKMGSTVVLALVQQDANETRAWIGHVGDSRAYLARAGWLIRLTSDHSAVQALLNRSLISLEEAGSHPDASVLTRSLGRHPEVEIDIEMVSLAAGDSLLLCSDGLWGYVPEQEIQRAAADTDSTAEATVKTLLEMALAGGGHDNIGIELARFSSPPAANASGQANRRGWMGKLGPSSWFRPSGQ